MKSIHYQELTPSPQKLPVTCMRWGNEIRGARQVAPLSEVQEKLEGKPGAPSGSLVYPHCSPVAPASAPTTM
jgi:hypothetical protein